MLFQFHLPFSHLFCFQFFVFLMTTGCSIIARMTSLSTNQIARIAILLIRPAHTGNNTRFIIRKKQWGVISFSSLFSHNRLRTIMTCQQCTLQMYPHPGKEWLIIKVWPVSSFSLILSIENVLRAMNTYFFYKQPSC